MQMTKERNISIDLIKAFAILGVLAIHISSPVLTNMPVGSFSFISGLFWGVLFRASVPLFLISSGAIMLDENKDLSIKRLYLHNIVRIVIAMLFWTMGYKIYHLIVSNQLTVSTLWFSLKRVLLFDHEFHFYYIHMILISYVFLPVTRLFVKNADKKLIQYAIFIWIILGIVYPSVKGFKPFNLLSGLTGQWAINLTYSSIGYGVLGYYLKKYPISKKAATGCALAGFAITFGLTYWFSQNAAALNEQFLQGTSFGVFLLAVGFFALSPYVQIKGVARKIVVYISKASFCIYLSHMFILYALEFLGSTAQNVSPVIVSVPLISLFVLLVCLGIYYIITKIPVLRNFII